MSFDYEPYTINYEARETASKVLIVFFIIITVATNLELLARCFRKRAALYHPTHAIKVSLAVGSVFMALFSYVVEARSYYFEDSASVGCHTTLTGVFYLMYFFPFVFGFGVCAMSVSVYVSQSDSNSNPNPNAPYPQASNAPVARAKGKCLVIAALPWVAAFSVVAPLTLAGVRVNISGSSVRCSWHHSIERHKAIVCVAVVVPACLAAVLSTLLYLVITSRRRRSPGLYTGAQRPLNTTPGTTFSMSTTTAAAAAAASNTVTPPSERQQNLQAYHHHHHHDPQENPQESPQQYPHQYPHQYPQQPPQQYPLQYPQQHPPQNPQQYSHQLPEQYPPQYPHQYPPQYPHQYPSQYSQQYPQQQHPPQYPQHLPSQYPQQYSPQHPQLCQNQILTTGHTGGEVPPLDLMKEAPCLVLSAFALFFSVMPLFLFMLTFILNTHGGYMGTSMRTILIDVFTWLMHVYPALAPLLWRFHFVN